MNLWPIVIVAATLFVAYANGANDNFKGVATLFGSGTTDYRKALAWATITTFAGSITALFLATKLISMFQGKGLVPDFLIRSEPFLAAVILGAALTVILADGVMFTEAIPGLRLILDRESVCAQRLSGTVVGISGQKLLDIGHVISAGAVSFARGLNDTPKLVALGLAVSVLDLGWSIALVALFMALGGLIHSKRIAETVGQRITAMDPAQGFLANLVTSFLVIFASKWGLPVSTTHVSCGALFGIGIANRQAHWKMIRTILMAWLLTLPTAALLSAGVYWLVR